jgi:hypothetical protein
VSSGWAKPDPIDAAWSGIVYCRGYLDLDMPSWEQVRAGLRTIISHDPAFGRWFAPDGAWRRVQPHEYETFLDLVMSRVDLPGPTPDQVFAAAPTLDPRFRIHLMVGPDWIAGQTDHSFGDGRTIDGFIAHLLRQARTEEVLEVPWMLQSPFVRDLGVGLGAMKHVGSLPQVFRERAAYRGGEYEVAQGHPAPRILVNAGDEDFMPRLRRDRKEHFGNASALTVAVAGLRAGIASAIGEPRPGFECLFNTRPEKPGTRYAWGNRSVGVFLNPDNDYAPDSIGAAIERVRRAGVPQIGLAGGRAAGRKVSDGPSQVVKATGVPRLTATFVPEHYFADVPGVRPGRTAIVTETVPNGLDTLTFQMNEIGGRLVVSTSFYAESWDAGAVESGVKAFLDQGIDLVRARLGGRA